MTRTAFLKKYFLRFAIALTLVSLIVYVLYHVFGSSADRLMRTPVRRITDEQILSGQAYLFRDETVLTTDEPGLINPVAVSGTKVSKGEEIAQVWSGDGEWSEAEQLQLDSLNRVIAILEAGQLPEGTPLGQIETLRDDAMTRYLTLCRSIKAEDWSALSALEDELLITLNQYASLTDSSEAVPEALQALRDERQALLGNLRQTTINEASSGYFYDRFCVDGYEEILSASALEGLTAARFFELTSSAPQDLGGKMAIGKMAYGYDWYFGVVFEAGAEEWFSPDDAYTVSMPENGDLAMKMICRQVLLHEDGRVVVIFSSSDHPSALSYLRSQRVEITVEQTEGYYVPESALREVDGVEGVYIFKDSTVYFRRIEVVYRGDGYCIVSEQNGREGYLALYDLLVTSGEDLYDGRVFQ